MGKLVAVQGCTIVCKTPSVSVASFQITTPPEQFVTAGGKPVYAGTLSVIATGITMGGFSCPTANFTIINTQVASSADNKMLILEGDGGICICVGTNGSGATTTINFRAEISVSGQTVMYASQEISSGSARAMKSVKQGLVINPELPSDFKGALESLQTDVADLKEKQIILNENITDTNNKVENLVQDIINHQNEIDLLQTSIQEKQTQIDTLIKKLSNSDETTHGTYEKPLNSIYTYDLTAKNKLSAKYVDYEFVLNDRLSYEKGLYFYGHDYGIYTKGFNLIRVFRISFVGQNWANISIIAEFTMRYFGRVLAVITPDNKPWSQLADNAKLNYAYYIGENSVSTLMYYQIVAKGVYDIYLRGSELDYFNFILEYVKYYKEQGTVITKFIDDDTPYVPTSEIINISGSVPSYLIPFTMALPNLTPP